MKCTAPKLFNILLDTASKHAGHIQQIFSQYRRLAFSADLL